MKAFKKFVFNSTNWPFSIANIFGLFYNVFAKPLPLLFLHTFVYFLINKFFKFKFAVVVLQITNTPILLFLLLVIKLRK